MNASSSQVELIRTITDIRDEDFLQSIKHFIAQRQYLRKFQVFSEVDFWKVIALFDWESEGGDDTILVPAVQYLSTLDKSKIQHFYDILSEKLYHLDTKAHANNSVEEGAYFSSDMFLYARCAVLANGQKFYEHILQKPKQFPKNSYFEALLSLPHDAYRLKTGEDLEHAPAFVFETGFNVIGWGEQAIQL